HEVEGNALTFKLTQSYGSQHTLGRLRIAVSDLPEDVLAVPESIRQIVTLASDQRTEAQQGELDAYYRTIAPQLASLREARGELEAIDVPHTPIMRDLPADKHRTTHVHIRGNFLEKGEQVEPGVPDVFHPLPEDAPLNRLSLAQ